MSLLDQPPFRDQPRLYLKKRGIVTRFVLPGLMGGGVVWSLGDTILGAQANGLWLALIPAFGAFWRDVPRVRAGDVDLRLWETKHEDSDALIFLQGCQIHRQVTDKLPDQKSALNSLRFAWRPLARMASVWCSVA